MVTSESSVQGFSLLVEKERKNHEKTIFYYASSAPLSSCRSAAFDEFRSGERANHDVHLPGPVAGYRHAGEWHLRFGIHAVGCGERRNTTAAAIAGDCNARVSARDRWNLHRAA